ncbi:MAG: hypothetical protein WCG26_03935, partial [Chloroflexales bacterium]
SVFVTFVTFVVKNLPRICVARSTGDRAGHPARRRASAANGSVFVTFVTFVVKNLPRICA